MCITFRGSGLVHQQLVRWPDPFDLVLYSYRDKVIAFREFSYWGLLAEALDLFNHIAVGSGPKDPLQLLQFLSGFSSVVAGFLQER